VKVVQLLADAILRSDPFFPSFVEPITIMNFVQQLEEYYRDLASEARKKHPGVKEASERAQLKLRGLQNTYIKQVRQANQLNNSTTASTSSNEGSARHQRGAPPTTALFASSELLHPFLIAANYPNASATPLLDISLSAMKLLLANEAVLTSDGIHMVRVWMIQSQVIASSYEKQYGIAQEVLLSETSSPAPVGSLSTANPYTASHSSWFSWGGSSNATSNSASTDVAIRNDTLSSEPGHHPHASAVKNAVSSSSGGVGGGTSSHQLHNFDRIASEILSCLLQLLQFMLKESEPDVDKGHNDLPPYEFWTNALALCVLWLPVLPVKHTVHQAARSTLSQVVSGLYSLQDEGSMRPLHVATWEDLLHLASRRSGGPASLKFHGALSLLKAPNRIPSRALGLELLVQVFSEARVHNHSFVKEDETIVTKTLSVCMGLLRENAKVTVDLWVRIAQWTCQLYLSLQSTCPIECTELLSALLSPITHATEACRQSHDFEDGFVFTIHQSFVPASGISSIATPAPSANPVSNHCLIPAGTLWKAGITLEAVASILERDVAEHMHLLFDPTAEWSRLPSGLTLILTLTEALSDFCTILASCKLHMLQLVDFAKTLAENTTVDGMFLDGASMLSSYYYYKPSLMRRAEGAIASANQSLFEETSTNNFSSASSSHNGKGGKSASGPSNALAPGNGTTSNSLLGETLFISMQNILRIVDCIGSPQVQSHQRPDRSAVILALLEETFAPTLATLQHYLKRFVGSRDLVQLALKGYAGLANICIPLRDEAALQRKALLTSLCKLSLPNWGMHYDPPSSVPLMQLQDHHIRALLFLFRIVHTHHDFIHQEWEIILWTCEELADMPIASPLLSDEAYHAALAVSAVLCRFAAFTTCFACESLLQMTDALTEIATSAMSKRDVVGDTETVVPQRVTAATISDAFDEKESFSGKIMSMGVRAIYGGSGGAPEGLGEKVLYTERTRNSFYEDYRRDFISRLSNTKATVRVGSIGKLPFSIALLTDVAMANSFRWKDCGERFSDMLSRLANSSPVVRPYAMDVVSMLTMSHVSDERTLPIPFIGPGRVVFADPMQSQLWAVEHVGKENKSNQPADNNRNQTQSQVLSPICHTIRTTQKADVAESSLGALVSILEGVGHNIDCEAWSIVINAISSLSGDPLYEVDRTSSVWSTCCSAAFRSLKFIVDDFLHQLTSSGESSSVALVSLLNCCSAFGRSEHDINTSLTAIGLLWTIADQDSSSQSIDLALSKLVMLAADNRQEVRNAAVNTLFSCLIGRGGTFSGDRWEACFNECIYRVYQRVITGGACDATVSSVQSDKPSRFQVARHHSRDSIGKQWITTQVLVLRGLLRVIRQFFGQLLESCDSVQSLEVPWFQDAWVKVLDFAFEAASQHGPRDALEIQAIGVEILAVCCQLSCEAGMQAAAAPARVGTNMEVVNGALRSVRETKLNYTALHRSLSQSSEALRRNLFLEAFEGVESYKELIETIRSPEAVDDSLLQVLHKFAAGLTQIFECCKGNELVRNDLDADLKCLEHPPKADADDNALDYRFVRIVTTTLEKASIGSKSRFLNQAQRCSISLLQAMALEGSVEASRQMVILSQMSLLCPVKEHGPGATTAEDLLTVSLISAEAASMLSDIADKASVRDVCKAFILYDVLLLLARRTEDNTTLGLNIKPVIPILTRGLAAVSSINKTKDITLLVKLVWTNFLGVLMTMLTLAPCSAAGDAMVVRQAEDSIEVVNASETFVVSSYKADLCKILTRGAKTSLSVSYEQNDFANKLDDDDLKSKALKYRDIHSRLFEVCFGAVCSIDPYDVQLRSIASQALEPALEMADGSDFNDAVALTVCRLISKKRQMENLVISVFPVLCKLASSPNSRLRDTACNIISEVKIADNLKSAQTRCDEAEHRAIQAETKLKEIEHLADELRRENRRLKKDVAVLEASAVL
jgi:hypothetical protein